MPKKEPNPEITTVSISMTHRLNADIDDRAAALGLNRSQYLQRLAVADLLKRGVLEVGEMPPEYRTDLKAAASKILSQAAAEANAAKHQHRSSARKHPR